MASAPSSAQQLPHSSRGECLSVPSQILGHAVNYCVVLPPSYNADKTRRYPTLYLLHGLGDNEQMLLRSGGMAELDELHEQGKIGEFLVVTPAGGASFYIDSRDGQLRYEDFLLREFFPAIEKRFRTRPGRASRGIGGISMGGYGALHLAFAHPELFGSVSTHSAALIEKLPAIAAASTASGRLQIFGKVFGVPFDRAYWDRSNPLTLARTADLKGLNIYFDCGLQDYYGFNAGAQALHDILQARQVPHEFHLYPGGHDWTYFAEHLPNSFEFQSRSFGAANTGR